MNIVVEKQPKCVATLRVEIPAETVAGQRDRIVRKYSSGARVPGFRPGKAPRAIIEKRFEKEIFEELREVLFNDGFDAALKQESLRVLDFGMPHNVTDHPDGAFSFESRLTLSPDVQLPDYKGIKVTVPPLEVPDEAVTAQLNGLRERYTEYKDISDRPAEMGDFAVMDYSSTVGGQPTDEFLGKSAGYLSGREGFWMKLDEKAFLPGFAAQVAGLNPGDAKEISLTLPEDFPVAELASKEMVFHVTVKELKQAEVPELDDELIARVAPGKSLGEVTEIIRENLQGERHRKIDDLKVNQIVAHFNALVDFELPEDLVVQETQSQADAMVDRGVQAGMTEEEIQSQQQEIFASAGHQAVANLRTNFILQEIARAEGIKVTDPELVNHLARIATSRKVAPKKFIKDMQREGRLQSVRSSMLIGKTIDFLVEHATVEETNEATLDDA
jgi:trigger factor